MRDMDFSVWTRIGGEPTRMGSLYVTESEARFSYANAYAQSGLPGLSLVYPPALFRDSTIVHRRSGSLHPRFHALIPPADEHNFQRKLMLAYLREKGVQPATPFEADLALLAHTGHGGIGHLDLFENDDRAQEWYANPPPVELHPISDELGFSLKEFMAWYEDDLEVLIQTVGPTPTVGGAIPKLLMSIPASGWDGRIGLPTRQKTPGVTDVVLKFEQTTRYPGITELEALALDMHREAGFEVPGDPEMEGRFQELEHLEENIGRTGLRALDGMEAYLRVFNLLDEEYETFGYFDPWGDDGFQRYYTPGAPRHFLVGVNYDF